MPPAPHLPIRRAILSKLSGGKAAVNEIASPFEISLPVVSKHLKVLERAGLIERGREAQWRPCRLRAGPRKGAEEWFDRLDEYPERLKNEDGKHRIGSDTVSEDQH